MSEISIVLKAILLTGLLVTLSAITSSCSLSKAERTDVMTAQGKVAKIIKVDSEYGIFNREMIADCYLSSLEVANKKFGSAKLKITNDTSIIQQVNTGTILTTFQALKPDTNIQARIVNPMLSDSSIEVDATAIEITILQ